MKECQRHVEAPLGVVKLLLRQTGGNLLGHGNRSTPQVPVPLPQDWWGSRIRGHDPPNLGGLVEHHHA
eukprot:13260914-Alexandrium_andersonii.AAC.1